MWTYRRILTMLAVGVFACTPAVEAQETGEQPVLRVGARAMTIDGARGNDAAIERIIKPGEAGTTLLRAGRLGDPEGSLCPMRAIDMPGHELSAVEKKAVESAAYVWKVTTTSVAYDAGRHTFDLDWQRFDRGADTPSVSGKQRLTLADGEDYTMDFMRGNAGGTCRTPGVVVAVSAGVREDPAFRDTVLRYDLWLVRQDRTGKRETRHLVLGGVHGAITDFQFGPLLSPVEKLQADQYDFKIATRVSGSVRGRMTRDGRISIGLETRRSDDTERDPSSPSSLPRRFSGGRKVLTVALGEVIEIQLPPASGNSSSPASEKDAREIAERVRGASATSADTRSATEPVAIRGGRLEVNYGSFFEGERMSVIVQVRKVEGAEDPVPAPAAIAGKF